MRWAVELRDPSWLSEGTYDILRHHNASLCIHDLLPHHPFVRTADWLYVRFHGPHATTRPYHGNYSRRGLSQWSERLADLLEDGQDVYCYFNNDVGGAAVDDARWLRQRLDGRLGGPASAQRRR